MRLAFMILICAGMCLELVSAGGLRAKARLLGRLAAHGRQHKRGVGHIPTYKLGHDIPVVTHSLLKPLVVTYPPAAQVTAVKVPLHHPLAHRLPHQHFGLKYPHHKAVLPDSHYHHHHHHVSPRPIVPVLPAPPPIPAAPIVPIAQPTATVAHPIPAPSPAFVLNQALPPHPISVAPAPVHVHPRPVLPVAPLPAPALAPAYPLTTQYVLRPGNAVQTSYFATYPRYPAGLGAGVLFGRPALPPVAAAFPAPAAFPATASFAPNLLLPTQASFPHAHVSLQPAAPTVLFQPSPPTFQSVEPHTHLLPTTPALPLDHGGWSPLSGTHAVPQDAHSHFVQTQGTQVFEHHTGDQQFHDQQLHEHQFQEHQFHEQQYHNQLLHEQQQHDQQFHDQQLHQHQLHDQQVHQHQLHDQQVHQHQLHDQQVHQHQLHDQQLHEQQLHDQQLHEQQFHDQQLQFHIQQQLEHALHEQQQQQHGFNEQHGYTEQNGYTEQHAGQEYLPPTPDYSQQQPGLQQEYGAPQQVEGRSGEDAREGGQEDNEPRFHNHIPLALQPPIDRPPEHFS